MLDWLFKQKKAQNTIVWGIRAPDNVRQRWLMLSQVMRVPCNRLVLYALKEWSDANENTLLDQQERDRLAEKITRAYLEGELE
jgi:hypothetical protein